MREQAGGTFAHFGMRADLLRKLREVHSRVINVDSQRNVDGILAFNNSRSQLWPIVCRLIFHFIGHPFAVGIYCGNNKPSDADGLCPTQSLI
ncbi:hypothetical protein CLF_109521 [Clonorchis sinensis]|uniref:Uncharacterized protein n=1 Tax=Clonorchis sinensis TaxID=79923 RepID=G7YSP5_CLOSI|nr:hypothetical protein CLF_109521 [Clonorchis sinensis]